ncbi:MAG: IS21 family transposase [Deltaproteobacteria bacterium]|nr:IS21 family transposase [Deltaproteobacteria bacterium]MBW2166044.1 IS21 family transposase [Deltaproteobacteria bacterium]
MLTVDQYEYIRIAHRVYGKTIREIARETGHSRNTVKKVLNNEHIEYSPRQNQSYPSLGLYLPIIDKWLKDDKDQPKKQRHTGTRIYNRLKYEKDYHGSISTVLRYVKIARQRIGISSRQVFIPLDPPVGQEAEVDWGRCTAILDGEKVQLKLFCIRSKFSGKHFVRCYTCERQQALFDAHIQAFSYFGGIFPVLIYDNLTTVVQKILIGKDRICQKEYNKFKAYYNFTARFCNPANGHEKGGVEGIVGYARRNYMVPVPQANSLEDLNIMLLQECLRYGDHRISGKENTVNEMYEQEKEHLLNIPDIKFSNIQTTNGKTDKYSTVIIDKNRYSVPTEYAYLKLRAVLKIDSIDLYYGNKKIAIHKRLYNVNQWSLDPLHYLKLIGQRPQAFSSARSIKQWRTTWPDSYEELLARFCKSKGETKGIKDFINVLLFHKKYNEQNVHNAVKKAITVNVSDSDAVLQILTNSLEKPTKSFTSLANWEIVPTPDIAVYNEIGGAI